MCYQKGMSGEDMFHQLMRSCEKGDYTYDAETHTIMSGDKPVVKGSMVRANLHHIASRPNCLVVFSSKEKNYFLFTLLARFSTPSGCVTCW